MLKKDLIQELIDKGLVLPENESALRQAEELFSVALTDQTLANIDPSNLLDPVALQFIPQKAELNIKSYEKSDPIGDDVHSPVKGIAHRYEDRCLLMPLLVCPVYCRFCFRKEKVGGGQKSLTRVELQKALDYIEAHPELWEVIITGGDPFFMPPKAIEIIMKRLRSIDHVEVIRFHTRMPVVDAKRVSEELIASLKGTKAVYVVLHVNHAKEFTEEAVAACSRLIDAGIPLLSQTVLLKGINDTVESMGALLRACVKHRIKPFYLHHLDQAKGTSHFRLTLKEGVGLMKQLRGNFSGLCQPTYVLDIPGGYGKIPLHHPYLQFNQETQEVMVEDIHGDFHSYKE